MAEQFDAVEFVYAEDTFDVERRGTWEKESGARFARIRGIFAATRDSRLLTSSNGCR